MNPGIDRYHAEWARFWRRLSLIAVAVSVVIALPFLWLMRSPEARDAINDPARFGFLGNEQLVRRIQLTALGAPRGQRADSRMISSEVIPTRKGGGPPTQLSDEGRTPGLRAESFRPPGQGDSEEDILARAMLRAGDTPLFQSRELVIEDLVEPIYPTTARDKGVEGRVAIMALVDTMGFVRQAEIVGSADRLLEAAAVDAVMQCRFRPYIVDGRTREVYAMFRFSFRLLN